MRFRDLAILAAGLCLTACSPAAAPEETIMPEEALMQAPEPLAPARPSEAALATRDELLAAARAGSLSRLTRLAEESDQFVSNLGAAPHRQYWDLMRRTGVDPNLKLLELFELPVGARTVDGEVWYVWPDLAALPAEALVPEMLTFQDRKRLTELVGEDGVEWIRAGQGYPGMRTAIAEDGRWVYFILDMKEED